MLTYNEINLKILRVQERLAGILTEKGADTQGKSIHQLLDLLSSFVLIPGEEVLPEEERSATTCLTLIAPKDLSLYGTDQDNVENNLRVSISGDGIQTYQCRGFDGLDFVYDILTPMCAGNRVLVDLGEGSGSKLLTIQWSNKWTGVLTETRTFDYFHTPQYFKRPSGAGAYNLKINGNIVALEVCYNGVWMEAPAEGLTEEYASCYIRTKSDYGINAIAKWTCNGLDSDPFWYLT